MDNKVLTDSIKNLKYVSKEVVEMQKIEREKARKIKLEQKAR